VHSFFATGRAYAGPLFAVALITLTATASLVGGQREVVTRTNVAFNGYLKQHSSTTGISSTTTMTSGSAADLNQATAEMDQLLPPPANAYTAGGWTFSIPEAASDLPLWLPHESPPTSKVMHQLPSAIELVDDQPLSQAANAFHYTEGHAPSCGGTCTGVDAAHPIPIAISAGSAAMLRTKNGAVIALTSTGGARIYVAVSGLFQAGAPAPAAAAQNVDSLLSPSKRIVIEKDPQLGQLGYLLVAVRALIAPDSFAAATAWTPANVGWRYQLRPDVLDGGQAAAFGDKMRALVSAANLLPTAGDAAPVHVTGPVFAPASVITGIPGTIAGFESDAAAARALGLFVLIGAMVVSLATLQLALRVVFSRQERDLALRRARGLGTAAAARRAAWQAALCVIPAAALGVGVALALVRGTGDTLAIGVGLAAVVGVPLAAAVTALVPLQPQAPLSRRRRALQRTRAAFVLMLLAAAITAARSQVSDATNPDFVSAALPTIAATVGALAVGGLVALLARPAAWLASGRTRAAALFLAAAHAARRPALPAAAAIALLVATSSAVFASGFTASLDSARQVTAWRQTGADLHMHVDGANATIPSDAEAAIAETSGVRASATGAIFDKELLTTKQGVLNLTVIVIDPAEYAHIPAGSVLDSGALQSALRALRPAPAASETVDAVISSNLGNLVANGDSVAVQHTGAKIDPVARLDSFPAVGGLGTFIVLPRDQVKNVIGLTMPITDAWFDLGSGNTDAVVAKAQAVRGVTVTDRQQRASGLASGPVGRIARWTSVAAVGYDLVLAVVCLLLAATLAAPSRAAGRAFLATLGARRSTSVAASAMESLPAFTMIAAVAAVAAFGALALLAPLIGQMAVGDSSAMPLSQLTAPAAAILAIVGIPALGLLLAAARAAAETRTRLSFLRDERAS
jgi:putative ABC transport system permease protein